MPVVGLDTASSAAEEAGATGAVAGASTGSGSGGSHVRPGHGAPFPTAFHSDSTEAGPDASGAPAAPGGSSSPDGTHPSAQPARQLSWLASDPVGSGDGAGTPQHMHGMDVVLGGDPMSKCASAPQLAIAGS
jgi:hypothetical protein